MYFLNFGTYKSKEAFCSEYQTVYDAMTNPPSSFVATYQNIFVKALKEAGVWIKADVIYLFAQEFNINSEALINWKLPGTYNASVVNTSDVIFTSKEGFKTGGDIGYIRTNYIPATHGINYTQNDAGLAIYIREGKVEVGYDMMANNPYSGIRSQSAANTMEYGINSASLQSASTDGVNIVGLFGAMKTEETKVKAHHNLTYYEDDDTPTEVIAYEIFIGCRNKVGSPDDHANKQYSFAYLGGGLTIVEYQDLVYAMENYLLSVKTEVLHDDTLTLQKYVDQNTIVPAKDYIVNGSIKVTENNKTVTFETGVTITASDSFSDNTHEVVVSKDRHAIFKVTGDDATFNFNNAIINCNQSTLLSGSKYMNCIFFHNCFDGKVENLEGNNTHNTVYANTVSGLTANNIEISDEGDIGNDNYKNCALDIQFCSNVSGAVFNGYGCEEVIDINDGNDTVTLSRIYGENTTQAVLEINDSKAVIVDNITAVNPGSNWLVRIQKYDDIPWANQNITLTNMQNNNDYSEPGVTGNVLFYAT